MAKRFQPFQDKEVQRVTYSFYFKNTLGIIQKIFFKIIVCKKAKCSCSVSFFLSFLKKSVIYAV